jgi:hypothetical protein
MNRRKEEFPASAVSYPMQVEILTGSLSLLSN